jgi:acyl-CoA thioesterase FadM
VFGYQLCTVGGESGEEVVVASGRSVQVCFDYQRQLKVPVPDSFRAGAAPYLVPAPAAPGDPGR